MKVLILVLLAAHFAAPVAQAQTVEANRLRETASPAERKALAEQRRAQLVERQELSFEQMRQQQKAALAAAAPRPIPTGPARAYFVNNETGNDSASGLASDRAVRSLAKAVTLLKPGDTLHLAVTSHPYRETLRLGDDFGGTPGKPITIEGHGATLTGSDPLRLGGWVEAGAPGLYKSAELISELEEFGDAAKLMRVFFILDGAVQHMGRSSKGKLAPFKAPEQLQPGEWTYVEVEKAFYLKVSGKLADAKIEVPYRRNGVGVRAPKIAVTHVIIKDLTVCHVLNDGFNLHGTTRDLLLQNIAAYECGDDGISPHETCEVTIDGFWSSGNSTGMGNGYLSVTKASNLRLEGNLAHQLMTAHAPVTELRNAIIIAKAGTQPVYMTDNSQDNRLSLNNVQISSPAGQKVIVPANASIEARCVTAVGPNWEIGGKANVTKSAIGGSVSCSGSGTWSGAGNVYDPTARVPGGGGAGSARQPVTSNTLHAAGQPFAGAGANASQFKIPPRPMPDTE